MKIIAHRGNLYGREKTLENSQNQILSAIEMGFDVEIDIWFDGEDLFLGHDYPQYIVKRDWLEKYSSVLWIHCKDLGSLELFNDSSTSKFNYFWHQADSYTLTSRGFIWVYPDMKCPKGSIKVVQGNFLLADLIPGLYGVCTDYPVRARDFYLHAVRSESY